MNPGMSAQDQGARDGTPDRNKSQQDWPMTGVVPVHTQSVVHLQILGIGMAP